MKNQLRAISTLVFQVLLLLSFNSCQDDLNEVLEQKDISIQEVEKFVNQNTNPNERSTKWASILYQQGVYKEIALGDALVFPIEPSRELYVSGAENTKRLPVASTSFVMAYKEGEQLYVDLVQPVPTTNDAIFTGYVLISQYGGDVKRVLYYKNGIFTHEKNASESNEGERTTGIECETIYYFWCTETSSEGGSYTSCVPDGSSTTCKVVNDGSSNSINPEEVLDAGPSSNGGGNGNSSDIGEKNCTNPFDPSIKVPCNDVTCGLGYISDGDGGCIRNPWPDGTVLYLAPDKPILDIEKYLECFDLNEDAELTVYVDQPVPETTKTHVGSDVGHVFISIEQGGVRRVIGFHPKEEKVAPLIDDSSISQLGDESEHHYDMSVSSTMSGYQLGLVLKYIIEIGSEKYELCK